LNATSVLIIDPALNSTSFITGISTFSSKWYGGVRATLTTNKIYGAPHHITSILQIDTSTDTADFTSLTTTAMGVKWSGGVLAPNGKIYFVPLNHISVCIVDPDRGTADTTTITNLGTSANKWNGGVLARNGKLYFAGQIATTHLVIDPATNTTQGITRLISGANATTGGAVLAPNGKIYVIPMRARFIEIIDPETNTV
jgi:streptogramin lyase